MKEIKSFLKHKRNLISLLIVLLLLATLPAGIYLSQKTTIFKPKAFEAGDTGTNYFSCSQAESDNGALRTQSCTLPDGTSGFQGTQYNHFDAASNQYYCHWSNCQQLPISTMGPHYNLWRQFMIDTFDIYPIEENGNIVLYDREHFIQKYCISGGCYLNDKPYQIDQLLANYQKDFEFITDLMADLYQDRYDPFLSLQSYFPELDQLKPRDYPGLIVSPFLRDQFKTYIDQDTLRNYILKINSKRGLDNADSVFKQKDPLKLLIGLSDPLFGTRSIIAWATLPPHKVTDEQRLNSLLGLALVYGITQPVIANGPKLASHTVTNLSKIASDVAVFKGRMKTGEAISLREIATKAMPDINNIKDEMISWLNSLNPYLEGDLRVPVSLGIHPVGVGSSQKEFWMLVSLNNLILKGKAYVLNPDIAKRFMVNVKTGLFNIGAETGERWAIQDSGGILRKRGLLPSGVELNQWAEKKWVLVVDDDVFISIYGSSVHQAFTGERVVIIMRNLLESRSNNAYRALSHELIHIISQINALKTGGRTFVYNIQSPDEGARVLSGIFELMTDDLAVMATGTMRSYALEPNFFTLYTNLQKMVAELTEKSAGEITIYDFYEFALTQNDEKLMSLISKYMDPNDFLSRVGKDTKLSFISDDTAELKGSVAVNIEAFKNKPVYTLYDKFLASLKNEDLPPNAFIFVPPFRHGGTNTPPSMPSPNPVKQVTQVSIVGSGTVYGQGALSCSSSQPNCITVNLNRSLLCSNSNSDVRDAEVRFSDNSTGNFSIKFNLGDNVKQSICGTASLTVPKPEGLEYSCLGPDRAKVKWDKIPGTYQYALRVDNLSDGGWVGAECVNGKAPDDVCYNTGDNNSLLIVSPGVNYDFWLHTYDPSKNELSDASEHLPIICGTPGSPTSTPAPISQPVSPPTLKAVSCGTNQATVSWDNVPGTKGYDLRADSSGITYSRNDCNNIHSVCVNGYSSNSITMSLSQNKQYRFWIHSVSTNGKSTPNFSETVINCPVTQASTTASNLSARCTSGIAELSWQGNADSYQLRVDADPASEPWNGSCASPSGDFCNNNIKDNTYTFSSPTSTDYKWWIHGVKGNTLTDAVYGPEFTCTQTKPNLITICDSQTRLRLEMDRGADSYLVRVDKNPDSWDGSCSNGGDFCINDLKQRSFTFDVDPNIYYNIWYHSVKNGIVSPDSNHVRAKCG